MNEVRPTRIVIAGGGAAAFSAASTLRREGYRDQIVMLCREKSLPYDRPPVSKDFLSGEVSHDDILLQPPSWYGEHNIDVRVGVSATALHAHENELLLADDSLLPYDQLLIATGGLPRELDVPGAHLNNVLYIRSTADAERLRTIATPGSTVCIVGGGFVGLEVAASLRKSGVEVVLLEAQHELLRSLVGLEVGQTLASLHRGHGVDIRLGQQVAAIEGTEDVHAVRTVAGDLVACDAVVVGVGLTPDVGWLEASPVTVNGGVTVDRRCRTNVAGIYAAGDVATFAPSHADRAMRGHWESAVHQGSVAALNMLGQVAHVDDVSSFWSDQYDWHLQYVGHAGRFDEVVFRGSPTAESFLMFYLQRGHVRAVLGLNDPRGMRQARPLVLANEAVDRGQLSDPGTALASLAPTSSSLR